MEIQGESLVLFAYDVFQSEPKGPILFHFFGLHAEIFHAAEGLNVTVIIDQTNSAALRLDIRNK